MKIAVVGPGAMGCLYAARLTNAGIDTTLVDYKPERARRLQEKGIQLERDGTEETTQVKSVSHVPSGMDLVIVLVKAQHTNNLNIPAETPVLTLQNGLGNVETLCSKVGSAYVLAGVTSEAATLLGEGQVRHVAAGVTRIGSWTSYPAEPTIQALQQAGFECEITDAPGQTLWEKVAVNAGINPLTALLDVPNGALLDMPEARQLMRDLVVESVKVASTEGYRFDRSLVEVTEETCSQTRDNLSSMLQDIRAGKRTEIDAISGEILRRAQLAFLPTPRTRVIWQLVKGLERK